MGQNIHQRIDNEMNSTGANSTLVQCGLTRQIEVMNFKFTFVYADNEVLLNPALHKPAKRCAKSNENIL